MPVIALTQGMGSLAQDVAEALAADLGLATLQHEVAERVANKMHVSKSLISAEHRQAILWPQSAGRVLQRR